MRRPRNYKMLAEVVASLLLVAGIVLITLGGLLSFAYVLAIILGLDYA